MQGGVKMKKKICPKCGTIMSRQQFGHGCIISCGMCGYFEKARK